MFVFAFRCVWFVMCFFQFLLVVRVFLLCVVCVVVFVCLTNICFCLLGVVCGVFIVVVSCL